MAGSMDSWRSKLNTKYSKQDIDKWDVKLKGALKILKQQTDNRRCFDCGVDDVTWASPKLGIFICVACSDVHRAAGAHITCVKNFNTYLWGPDEVALMTAVGNTRGRALYGKDMVNSGADKTTKVTYCTRKYGDANVQQLVAKEVAEAKLNAEKSLTASTDVKQHSLPRALADDTPSILDFFGDFKPEPSIAATRAMTGKMPDSSSAVQKQSLFPQLPRAESQNRPDFFDDLFEKESTDVTNMDGQDGYTCRAQPCISEASINVAPTVLTSPTLLQVRTATKAEPVYNMRADGGQDSLDDFLTSCNPPDVKLDTAVVIGTDDDLFAGWESWS